MYFKLLPKVGNHSETGPDGKVQVYEAEEGVIIESDSDLVTRFPGKFERVNIPSSGLKQNVDTLDAEKTPVQKAAEQGAKDIADPILPPGRDVTDRFPKAREEDFKVFADGGAFFVVEADDPGTPLHDKPLKRKDVAPFIQVYLKG